MSTSSVAGITYVGGLCGLMRYLTYVALTWHINNTVRSWALTGGFLVCMCKGGDIVGNSKYGIFDSLSNRYEEYTPVYTVCVHLLSSMCHASYVCMCIF